jgi:3-methyl-2-oxobutanoate hydroxymethyltransferase
MRLTLRDIHKMKKDGERIVMVTAYDATSARLCEQAEIPLLLVGDTLGMVVQGHDSTIPVTLDQMIYHCAIVARVTERPFIVGDLPFMSYSISAEQAMQSAARIMQEGGATCVKLEGGERMAGTIRRLVHAGIPVMAHIGLTPQSVNQVGGFRVQGRDLETARQVMADAEAVQEAGAFAVVLELVPAKLSAMITARLRIPTIGIGAGVECDGQVQVFHDIMGLFDALNPKHTRKYIDAGAIMRKALAEYKVDVMSGRFPTDANSFNIDEQIIAILREEAGDGDR